MKKALSHIVTLLTIMVFITSFIGFGIHSNFSVCRGETQASLFDDVSCEISQTCSCCSADSKAISCCSSKSIPPKNNADPCSSCQEYYQYYSLDEDLILTDGFSTDNLIPAVSSSGYLLKKTPIDQYLQPTEETTDAIPKPTVYYIVAYLQGCSSSDDDDPFVS